MLSIIICTYNRAELLDECLKTLVDQTLSPEAYEILIVDNNCTDNTKDVVRKYQQQYSNIKYFHEAKVGLSNARNRGSKEAKSNNLLYLDDDILAANNTCETALQTFTERDWDAFGGIYTQWFYYGKPKWFPETWNTNVNEWDKKSVLPRNKYAIGCVFAIRKDKLWEVSGFNPNYGMTGNKIGYGEETDVQIKLRKKNYQIGFNPDIKVKHIVPKHKLKIGWHLCAAWKNQVAALSMNPHTELYPFWKTLKRILVASIKRLKYFKMLFGKNYYWQNFAFDYSEPIIRLFASLYALYLKPKRLRKKLCKLQNLLTCAKLR